MVRHPWPTCSQSRRHRSKTIPSSASFCRCG